MNALSSSADAAPRPSSRRRVASRPAATTTTRRLFSLAKAVRDLAGWTLPAHRSGAGRQPEGWQWA